MLERGSYSFRAYDPFERFVQSFFYDTGFSNENTQKEKTKHNFSTRHWQTVKKDGKDILIYDVSGLNPSEIIVNKVSEGGTNYILVKGSSKNEILDTEMTIEARWAIPYKQFKKPTKKIENGFLYVFLEPETSKEEIETI
jgi:hypothetical protein